MNHFLFLIIGLCAGWLYAQQQGILGWMILVYMGVAVAASMIAGALVSLVFDLAKTLLFLVVAAVLVVWVLNSVY
jgi:hypothetical protein